MKNFLSLSILLFLLISCSEKVINPVSTNDDAEAPDAIADMSIVFVTENTVTLYLTATGDDGSVGRARIYDVRYSTSPIDAANFSFGTKFTPPNEPNVGGNLDTIIVPGLSSNTKYYFAMKAGDEIPNWSEISNVDTVTTLLEGGWTIFNTSNSEILSNNITDVKFDGGTKYIATDGGASSLLNSTWTKIYESRIVSTIDTTIVLVDTTIDTTFLSLPNFVNSIAVESSDKIWLGLNNSGVALFESDSLLFYSSNDSGLLTSTVDLAISQNKLWVGTSSNGLHSLTLDGSDVWDKYNVPIKYPGIGRINCIDATPNNAIWTGLQLSGASVLENSVFTNYNKDHSFTDGQVTDITSTATKTLFATDEGLYIFENNMWTTRFSTADGLPDNVITAVAIDAQGIIWCGTRFGLAKYDGSQWTVITTANSFLPDNWINSLDIDDFGNIWIGTNNGLARLSY